MRCAFRSTSASAAGADPSGARMSCCSAPAARERNARWAHARRRYDAGYGVRSLASLSQVVAFFEERRGRLHGFRFRDRTDCSSSATGGPPQASDQLLGMGDGTKAAFGLCKTYGAAFAPYVRAIAKPVAGSVLVAVAGTVRTEGTHYRLDPATGLVTFKPGSIPAPGEAVTAGFAFDVPVRFDATGWRSTSRPSRPGRSRRSRSSRSCPEGDAMRSIPDDLAAEFASGATTLCRCWRALRRDGRRFGFTDHDRDLVFDRNDLPGRLGTRGLRGGEPARARGRRRGGRRSAERGRRQRGGDRGRRLGRDLHRNLARGLARHDAADAAGRRHDRRYPPAGRDLHGGASQPRASLRPGTGPALRGALLGGTWRPALPRSALGARPARRCHRRLGRRCQSVHGRGCRRLRGRRLHGRVAVFTGGANGGRSLPILAHASDGSGQEAIALWSAPPAPIAAGDAVTLTVGCDKRFSTCRDKFANALNFRGFPHIPGNDFIATYARQGEAGLDGGTMTPMSPNERRADRGGGPRLDRHALPAPGVSQGRWLRLSRPVARGLSRTHRRRARATAPYSADWAEASRREAMAEAALRHLTPIPPEAYGAGDVLLFRWRRTSGQALRHRHGAGRDGACA